MSKSIKDYLPKQEETTLVQAHVKKAVVQDAKDIMGEHGLTWADVIEACLKRFIDEMKPQKK